MDTTMFTDLALAKSNNFRNLILTTDSGRLFTYPMPEFILPGAKKPDRELTQDFLKAGLEAEVSNFHYGGVSTIQINQNTVITGGKDGSILVYEVKAASNKHYGSFTRKLEETMQKLTRRAASSNTSKPIGVPTPVQQKEDTGQSVQEGGEDKSDAPAQPVATTGGNRIIEETESESSADEKGPTELQGTKNHHLLNVSLIEKTVMEEWRKQ